MGVSLTYEQGNYVTIDAAVLITVLSLLFMHKLQRTRGRELEVSSVDQSTVTGWPKHQIKSEGRNTKINFVSQRFRTELGAAKGDKKERLPASALQMSKTAA